jgi:IS5 family transposase
MENRNGLLVDFQIDVADGRAERRMALEMLDESLPGARRITLGADKGYDTREFVAECRARNVTPHVAQKQHSAIDKRTAGSVAYAISLRMRKRVEEAFGWMKTVGNFRKTRYVGIGNNQLAATMVATAYNLIRIATLLEQAA